MKYTVHWHDYEDGRSGTPIVVAADSPTEAYWVASEQLSAWAAKFRSIDIELLIDDAGTPLDPDVFLGS